MGAIWTARSRYFDSNGADRREYRAALPPPQQRQPPRPGDARSMEGIGRMVGYSDREHGPHRDTTARWHHGRPCRARCQHLGALGYGSRHRTRRRCRDRMDRCREKDHPCCQTTKTTIRCPVCLARGEPVARAPFASVSLCRCCLDLGSLGHPGNRLSMVSGPRVTGLDGGRVVVAAWSNTSERSLPVERRLAYACRLAKH